MARAARDETVEVGRKRRRKDPEAKPRPKKRKRLPKVIESGSEHEQRVNKRLAKRQEQLVDAAIEAELIVAESPESVYLSEYNHIFESLQNLTRIAEAKYADSKASKDIYALMAMYSQMRECIADMRTIQDMSHQSDRLLMDIVEPIIKTFGESLVHLLWSLKKGISDNIEDPRVAQELARTIDETFAAQAKLVQGQAEITRQKAREFFNG